MIKLPESLHKQRVAIRNLREVVTDLHGRTDEALKAAQILGFKMGLTEDQKFYVQNAVWDEMDYLAPLEHADYLRAYKAYSVVAQKHQYAAVDLSVLNRNYERDLSKWTFSEPF